MLGDAGFEMLGETQDLLGVAQRRVIPAGVGSTPCGTPDQRRAASSLEQLSRRLAADSARFMRSPPARQAAQLANGGKNDEASGDRDASLPAHQSIAALAALLPRLSCQMDTSPFKLRRAILSNRHSPLRQAGSSGTTGFPPKPPRHAVSRCSSGHHLVIFGMFVFKSVMP